MKSHFALGHMCGFMAVGNDQYDLRVFYHSWIRDIL